MDEQQPLCIPVLCVMGPTATGKTDVALALSTLFNAEIVSVDSTLIYQGLNIGSAKPTPDIMAAYPHHLIDIITPTTPFSVADFVEQATSIIFDIHQRGKLALCVGGTMMYFHALQQGLMTLPGADINIRQQLKAEYADVGLAPLYAELQCVDPVSAARIHAHDTQRTLRALEVYRSTGKALSLWQREAAGETRRTPLQFFNYALMPHDRNVLHTRIAARFDAMLAAGFVQEVQALRQLPGIHADLPAMRAVGYRQVWQYCEGEVDEQTMREKGIYATQQLAKRQMTWLREWPELMPIVANKADSIRAIFEHYQSQKRHTSAIA